MKTTITNEQALTDLWYALDNINAEIEAEGMTEERAHHRGLLELETAELMLSM